MSKRWAKHYMNLKKGIKWAAIVALLVLSGGLGFWCSWYTHFTTNFTANKAVQTQALAPPIATRDTVHYPVSFVQQLAHDADAGRKIFNEFCAACHSKSPPIEVHAPRIDDRKAWEQRQKQGADRLLQHTLTGMGAMPARGGCFECSDEQLNAAINYILKQRP